MVQLLVRLVIVMVVIVMVIVVVLAVAVLATRSLDIDATALFQAKRGGGWRQHGPAAGAHVATSLSLLSTPRLDHSSGRVGQTAMRNGLHELTLFKPGVSHACAGPAMGRNVTAGAWYWNKDNGEWCQECVCVSGRQRGGWLGGKSIHIYSPSRHTICMRMTPVSTHTRLRTCGQH